MMIAQGPPPLKIPGSALRPVKDELPHRLPRRFSYGRRRTLSGRVHTSDVSKTRAKCFAYASAAAFVPTFSSGDRLDYVGRLSACPHGRYRRNSKVGGQVKGEPMNSRSGDSTWMADGRKLFAAGPEPVRPGSPGVESIPSSRR